MLGCRQWGTVVRFRQARRQACGIHKGGPLLWVSSRNLRVGMGEVRWWGVVGVVACIWQPIKVGLGA